MRPLALAVAALGRPRHLPRKPGDVGIDRDAAGHGEILREGDFNLLVELIVRYAFLPARSLDRLQSGLVLQIPLAPKREGLAEHVIGLVEPRAAGAVDFIVVDQESGIGQCARRICSRTGRLRRERRRLQRGTELPCGGEQPIDIRPERCRLLGMRHKGDDERQQEDGSNRYRPPARRPGQGAHVISRV